jgi:hypothetical protein
MSQFATAFYLMEQGIYLEQIDMLASLFSDKQFRLNQEFVALVFLLTTTIRSMLIGSLFHVSFILKAILNCTGPKKLFYIVNPQWINDLLVNNFDSGRDALSRVGKRNFLGRHGDQYTFFRLVLLSFFFFLFLYLISRPIRTTQQQWFFKLLSPTLLGSLMIMLRTM